MATVYLAQDLRHDPNGAPHVNYDVSPDGQTFAMVGFNQASRIVILQHLPALMAKLRGGVGSPR